MISASVGAAMDTQTIRMTCGEIDELSIPRVADFITVDCAADQYPPFGTGERLLQSSAILVRRLVDSAAKCRGLLFELPDLLDQFFALGSAAAVIMVHCGRSRAKPAP